MLRGDRPDCLRRNGVLLAAIDAVTLDDVCGVAAELFTRPTSLAVIGPYDEGQEFAA